MVAQGGRRPAGDFLRYINADGEGSGPSAMLGHVGRLERPVPSSAIASFQRSKIPGFSVAPPGVE
jgi:hypothetical protein